VRDAFIGDIREAIERHGLIPDEANVVVGVSGGADSVALLRALCLLGIPVTVAHLNHQLRGAESEADERFVRELAEELSLPVVVKRAAVCELAETSELSLEMAARQARHEFFATFENSGGIFGFDGCNQFSTSFMLDGDALVFEPALLTHVGCKAPEASLADQVHEAYKATVSYEILGETLRLLDADGTALAEFAQAPSMVLAGTTWSMMVYRNADGEIMGAVPDTEVIVAFSTGNLTGNTGCVSFNTVFSADGNEFAMEDLVILPLGAPTIDCETAGPVLDQQNGFLGALANADRYNIAGTSLSLNDESGEPVAVLLSMAEYSPVGPQSSETPSPVELERLANAEDLFNQTWYWVQKSDDGEAVSVETPSDFTLVLDSTGEMEAASPCGVGEGNWRLNKEELSLDFVVERRFCRDDEEVSTSYLSDLGSVVIYQIQDDQLILTLQYGTGDLIFELEPAED
jgi:heat shock protein HslJ